ncbi:uncharacterized protein LOC111298422 [Durio zibethinus]|uniref:Uncharacterized protein LOC111298422 n=1 Tax=Durio zibethinus TaxID=66656 RepID=A0A6P5Z8X6_DURZI|nr:uncharacterized protein LOC111298422 [Durio zibethinus]
MATSPLNIRLSFHSRSNSLPSRQHPIALQVGEIRLMASETASTSSSSSSIGHNLNGLQDLHECVDLLLQLPLTLQVLAQEQHRQCVELLLDRFLLLLDVCSTAKDALLQTKECTQELQSVFRRRRGAEMGLVIEVRKYLTSRKAMKKVICKALKNLKQMETKSNTSSFNNDGENGDVISILREVEAVTVRVLQSLLSFISGPDAESKLCRWSLVLKLMHQKRVGCVEEQNTNEIANAEAALRSLIKSDNIKHIENVQIELQKSELCIQDLEEGLENLFRRLIKARVIVLNILNCYYYGNQKPKFCVWILHNFCLVSTIKSIGLTSSFAN